MRRLLAGALLVAGSGTGVLLSGVVTASAGPTEQCNTPLPSTPLGQTSVLAPSSSPSTSGELQVCENGSPVVDGTITAEGNANPPGGYAVADGSGEPGHATGYIGVEGGTGGVAVVGCSRGDYNNGTNSNNDGKNGTSVPGPNDGTTDANGNNVIVDSSGQGSAVSHPTEIGTGGSCSLSNEPTP